MERLLLPPLVLVLVCLVRFASAATILPDCPRPLTLGLHEHGLLYSAETDSGIDKDVTEELGRRSGCKIVTSVMPRARIWQLIETGALDFSLSGITNPDRDRYAAFAWYFTNKYYLLVRNDAHVRDVGDFERDDSLRLGVIRSFRYSQHANDLVDRLQDRQRIVYATALTPLYETLMSGQIQGMIVEPFDYPILLEKKIRGITGVVDFNDPSVLHGLIMSRKTIPPEEQEKWRNILNDMRRDGTMLKIFQKYFSDDWAKEMVNF